MQRYIPTLQRRQWRPLGVGTKSSWWREEVSVMCDQAIKRLLWEIKKEFCKNVMSPLIR
jgi:hypothetical protein